MAYDKIDELYDALKKDGAVSHDRNNFRAKMLAPGNEGYQNRLQLFNALKKDGAVSSPTYEAFAAKLGMHAVPTAKPKQQQKPQAWTAEQRKQAEAQLAQNAEDNARLSRQWQQQSDNLKRQVKRSRRLGPDFAGEAQARAVARTAGIEEPTTSLMGTPSAAATPVGVVKGDDGKWHNQYELEDGSLTTDFGDVMRANEQHDLRAKMRRRGIDPDNADEGDVMQVYLDKAFDAAVRDDSRSVQEAASEASAGHGSWVDNFRNAVRDEDPQYGDAEFIREIKRAQRINPDAIVKNALELMPPSVLRGLRRQYGLYFEQHPKELKGGQNVQQAAEEAIKAPLYQQVYNKLVAAHAPKSTLEYLLRKITDQPLFSQHIANQTAAGAITGNHAQYLADEQAMSQYGNDHPVASFAGMVGNMAADPFMYAGGYVGSLASKAVARGIGRAVVKNASKKMAERLASRTLAGRIAQGVAAGAGNMGVFEAGHEAVRQDRTGEHSVGGLLAAAGRGVLLGAATGVAAPLIGNVADKLVARTASTGGKLAVRAGETTTSVLAEGTIFAAPELYENAQLADDDPNKRSGWSIWAGNLGTMAGIKGKHLIESAPRVIAELRTDGARRGVGFEGRLRDMLDRAPADLQMTKADLQELRDRGYGGLAQLYARWPTPPAHIRRGLTESEKKAGIQRPETEELGKTKDKDLDGYATMQRLMDDHSVSAAVRAKAYYLLTGKVLPMPTVLSYDYTNNEDGTITITAMGAENPVPAYGSCPKSKMKEEGADVVLRKTFKSRKEAMVYESKLRRQIELNTVDVGEQLREAQVQDDALDAAIDAVYPNGNHELLKNRYWSGDKAIREALDKHMQENPLLDENSPRSIQYNIEHAYGVDIDKALKKEPKRRSEEENAAIAAYVDELYNFGGREEATEAAKVGGGTDGTPPAGAGAPVEETTEDAAQQAHEEGRQAWADNEEDDAALQGAVDEKSARVHKALDRLNELFDEEAISVIEEDPDSMLNSPTLSEEHKEAIREYVAAKAALDGMQEASQEAAEQNQAEVENEVVKSTHKETKLLMPATMKDDSGNPVSIYVVDGKLVVNTSGGIDTQKSAQTLVVYDPNTGQYHFVDPKDIIEIGQPVSPADAVQSATEAIQQRHQSIFDNAQQKLLPAPKAEGGEGEKPNQGGKPKLPRGRKQVEKGLRDLSEAKKPIDKLNTINTILYNVKYGVEGVISPEEQALVDKTLAELKDEGYEIRDIWEGRPYTEGMKVTADSDFLPLKGENQWELKDGEVKIIKVVKPEVWKDGKLVQRATVVVGMRDDTGWSITERKLEEQKAHLEREKERNAPATVIKFLEDDVTDLERELAQDKAREHLLSLFTADEITAIRKDPFAMLETSGLSEKHKAAIREYIEAYGIKREESESTSEPHQPIPMGSGALASIPKTEKGEPVYEQAEPATAWQAILEQAEGDNDMAASVVDGMVADKEAAVKKAEKAKPKHADTVSGKIAAEKERKAAIERAKAELEAWKKIAAAKDEHANAAKAQKAEEAKKQDEERHAAAVAKAEKDKAEQQRKEEEQKAVGMHAVNPKIKQKWDGANKIEGNANVIVLPDGSTLRGHYVLTEAGAATASHDAANGFEPTEGFPVDENGQSVNDRDYGRDKDAQRMVDEMANGFDSRALQSPVIVSQDGVVLSGNNRTMSGDIAAKQGTDKAYVDHLKEFGQMYGFTPEQIDGMQHPRVVFVPDEPLPYDAATFARFNAETQKRQSKPEAAVKLGKTVPDNVFGSIATAIGGYDKLSDFYADSKAVNEVLKRLLDAGVINEMQLPELRTGNALSAAGKELIENLLIGKAFQSTPDAVRQLIAEPNVKQAVVMALSEIAHNHTLEKSGYGLSKELAEAIDLVYRARKSNPDMYKNGVAVSPFGRQLGLFGEDSDKAVTDGAVLLLADVLSSGKISDLRKVLAAYNAEATESASGQADIFSGKPLSKEEILKTVTEHFKNATRGEQKKLVDAAVDKRKQTAAERGGRGKEGEQAENADERGEESGSRKPAAGGVNEPDGPGGGNSAVAVKEKPKTKPKDDDDDGPDGPAGPTGGAAAGGKGEPKGSAGGGDHPTTPPEDNGQPKDDATQKPASTRKIEDVGEHIAGARKDELAKMAQSLGDVTLESLIELPASKAFKRPDLKKAVKNGVLREEDARFAEAVMAAFLGSAKPKLKDGFRRAKSEAAVRAWAEHAKEGVDMLAKLFSLDAEGRDKFMAEVRARKMYREEEVRARQRQMEQWNPGKVFNGTCYPLNPVDVMARVMERLGYEAGAKVSLPVVAAAPDSTFDLYILQTRNGKTYYPSRQLTTIDDVVDEMVYAAKVENADPDTDHPAGKFSVKGVGAALMEPTGKWEVKTMTSLTSMVSTHTFDTKEEAEKFSKEYNASGKNHLASEPREQTRTTGYSQYEIVYRHDSPTKGTYTHMPTGKVYGSLEEARAAIDGEHDELNGIVNAKLAEEKGKSGEKKDPFKIVMYTEDGKTWKYGVVLADKYAPKKTAHDTMPFYLGDGFATHKEAQAFLEEHREEWNAKISDIDKARRSFTYFNGTGERKGTDWRKGKDVSAEQLMEQFGFRGVQFGIWTNQRDRQAAVNNAFDALMDLAQILGVSPRAISLNGELGLAFGSRGSGGAAAHYEPSEVVINLTKTQGAGSLAHEWWHALDNYFARHGNVKLGMVTESKGISMRDALRKAYNDLIDSVAASDYNSRSRDRGASYWGRPAEETARLFAAWVNDELQKRDMSSPFLSDTDPSVAERYAEVMYSLYKAMAKDKAMTLEEFKKTPLALRGFVYPSTEELESFGEHLRNIFNTVQEKVDKQTGKTLLYHRGPVVEEPDEAEQALLGVVNDALKDTGIEVSTDVDAGQKVLDAGDKEDVRLMGSHVKKRMNEIGAALENSEMTDEQRKVTDVFSGKTNNMRISVKRGNGSVTLQMRQGAENKAGTKHSIFRHYGTGTGYITAEDVMKVTQVMSEGVATPKQRGKTHLVEYKLTKDGVTYTLVTEKRKGGEIFNDFYTNRKAPQPGTSNTLESAHTDSSDASDAAKVGKNSETANDGGKEKPRFFRTPDGEAYGFTVGGKIYVDPRIARADTPIHEYTHLWGDMMRRVNPKAWGDIVRLMKGKGDLWEWVKKNYPELKTDDEIADEVLAQFSGKRGAERLREEMRKVAEGDGSITKKAAAISALARVKEALGKFWRGVAELLHIRFTTAEEVADRVLNDLLHNVDPRKVGGETGVAKEKDGIRFSLRDKDKTLAGVHNISEDKLRKALKLGGLANPSLAVVDTDKNDHSSFGEISLIAPSSLVDKRSGRTAGTWSTDAYTQRYPQVERQMSGKGHEKFKTWVSGLDFTDEEKREIERQTKDALESGKEPDWGLMYLHDKGVDVKGYSSQVGRDWEKIIEGHPTAEDIIKAMGQDPDLNDKVSKLAWNETVFPIRNRISLEVREQIMKETGERLSPISPRVKKAAGEIFDRDYAPALLDMDGKLKAEDVKKVVSQMVEKYDATKRYDFQSSKSKANAYIQDNGLHADYLKWMDAKLGEFGVKGNIFRGFKDDGTRKYVPETLDNVSRVMREEAQGMANGGEYTSFGSFIAKFAPRVDSKEEMRDNKGRLATEEAKQAFYDKWEDTYYGLAEELGRGDAYSGEMRLHDIAMQPNPKEYAKKEYGITLSGSFVDKLNALKKAIREDLKSPYFETKFERPVKLGEFSSAVVPKSIDADVRKRLEDAGLTLYDYDPQKEGDRKRAFDEATQDDGVRFRLLDDDDPKAQELESLGDDELVPVYRNVQVFDDDSLGSPMAFSDEATGERRTLEGGKWNYSEPREVKLTPEQQKQLDELNKNGYLMVSGQKTNELPIGEGLKFVKPKTKPAQLQYFLKKSPEDSGLWAAYNPYDHAIETPLNTQFGEAYKRPNLVVVRSLMPKSELEGHYKADYAKDSTGAHKWNNGRTLYLSRYSKIDKVLTREEEAKLIDKYWKENAGKREALKTHRDYKRFVPAVRRELEKMGYRFEYDGKELTPEETRELDRQQQANEPAIPGEEGRIPDVTAEDIERINAKMSGKWVGEPKETLAQSMVRRVKELAAKLGAKVRIVTSADELAESPTRRQRKMKGMYDTKTGEVTIMIGNHENLADVENTVLHEVVGHRGFRILFDSEEKLNHAMNELYRVSGEKIRTWIDKKARKLYDAEVDRIMARKRKEHASKGEDPSDFHLKDMANAHVEAAKKKDEFRRIATEEYGANLAGRIGEKGFEKLSAEEQTFWGRLKSMLQKALQRLAEGLNITSKHEWTDKDWAYVLHEAYKREKNGGKPSIFDEADTIATRMRTGFGEGERKEEHKMTSLSGEKAKQALNDIFGKKSQIAKPEEISSLARFREIFNKPIRTFLGEIIKVKDSVWNKMLRENRKDISGAVLPTLQNADFAIRDTDGSILYVKRFLNSKGEKTYNVAVVNKHGELEDYISSVHVKSNGNLLNKIENGAELLIPENRNGYGHEVPSSSTPDAKIDKENEGGNTFGLDNGEKSSDDNPDEGMMFRDGDDDDIGEVDLGDAVDKMRDAAAEHNANNLQAKRDAMKAIGGNLSKLRQAMSQQKVYDKSTVKDVTDLAREMLENGMLDSVSNYEAKRLLSTAANVTGAENTKRQINKLMDVMIGNQLRNAANTFGKLLHSKGTRVNASGVEVQGKLDPDGAATVDALKKGVELDEKALNDRISKALDNLGSEDKAIADQAANEYTGLKMAERYLEDIKGSKTEEAELRDSMKEAKAKKDAGQMSAEAYKQYCEATEEAIRQNKIERADAYRQLIAQLGGVMGESAERAKAWREAEKKRVQDIQHNANSDMQGRPCNEHYKPSSLQKLCNSSIVQFFLKPLATFEQMLRMFGNKNVHGEGYLWNRYVRGWLGASENEYNGYRDALKELDDKVSKVFGKKMRWGDIFSLERKLPTMEVNFWDGGEMKPHTLTQGNLAYIYMVDKMSDGRMKLRAMGITDEVVEQITKALDPRLKELADWMQNEFLVEKRNKYNEVHKRMYGASMAAIENYFPLKILAGARTEVVDTAQSAPEQTLASTVTGSIIKRRRNNLALDVTNADAFSVILEHLQSMENWAAYAEFKRDLNTLLSYRRFKNQVMNMSSAYGAGTTLWNNFFRVCQIAEGVYRPPVATLDKTAVNFAKGVTAAKISFRVFTALKQLLSFPAYLPDASAKYLLQNLANPVSAWKWSMENLPLFHKRWNSRMAGDPRLLKTEMDWKAWRSRVVQIASKYGMSPNAFVDAVTVAMGANAIYKTRLAKYLKQGYEKERAEEKARQDAEIAYNQTQQSSEGAFLSTMQADRSWLSVLLTIFRNSAMSYTRQEYDALRNLARKITTKGYKEKSVEFMTKQMVRDGLDEDTALRNAKREYKRSTMREFVRVATFGYILQLAWNLGAYLPYLLLGDNDDEKKKMLDDAGLHALMGSVEGMTGGDVLSAAGQYGLTGNGDLSNLSKEMPLASDLNAIYEKFGYDKVAATNDVINLLVQAGVGVNPQSLTDAVVGVMDYCDNNPTDARECALLIARIFNTPQSQLDKIYFDEIDLDGSDASKLSPKQIAERYAKYKMRRNAPLTGWMYGEDGAKERAAKYEDAAYNKAKDRLSGLTDRSSGQNLTDWMDEYKQSEKTVSRINKLQFRDPDKFDEEMGRFEDTPAAERYHRISDYMQQIADLTKQWQSAKTPAERMEAANEMVAAKKDLAEDLKEIK